MFCALAALSACAFAQLPIGQIHHSAPPALAAQRLLVPEFELTIPEAAQNVAERQHMLQVNRQVREANTIMFGILAKSYGQPFELAPLRMADSLAAAGVSRYFLDMALMPKQLEAPKPAAMVPVFQRHRKANTMFYNTNLQFYYYFYIRDLQSQDVWLSSRFKGYAQPYKGMQAFLRRIAKDLQAQKE